MNILTVPVINRFKINLFGFSYVKCGKKGCFRNSEDSHCFIGYTKNRESTGKDIEYVLAVCGEKHQMDFINHAMRCHKCSAGIVAKTFMNT